MLRFALAALAFSAVACQPASDPPEPPPRFEVASADPVAQGERLGRVLGCRGCHGDNLTGRAWIDDPREAILFTSNLTRATADYDDAQLAHAIREGIRADGSPLWWMPSDIFTHLSEPDMAALIAWLRTLPPSGVAHPRLVMGPEGRRMVASGEIRPAPHYVRENRDKSPPQLDGRHEWARYMARATCGECHGIDLAGDAHASPDADRPAPDLDVVGAYSRDQFRHLMRTGDPPGGRELRLMGDVARGRFARFTAREVDAIYDYLAARAQRPR